MINNCRAESLLVRAQPALISDAPSMTGTGPAL